jgi:anaerobic magnesium-protoporphyrin IX monomethyl ester cyclase
MKILFIVDTSGPHMNREPLGLMHISALLKQHGHVCDAFDLAEETDLVAAVRERDPQLLAFSAVSGLHRRLVCASREILEELDVLSIFGGPHPTYFPEMIEEEGVDVICRGEGEYPMLELVEALEAGANFRTIPNLWVKQDGQIHRNQLRPFVQNLDDLPWPDRELFATFSQLHTGNARSFMGGRGCPYDCTYAPNATVT